MAPPPPPKTANRVARPAARYRPGKAPLGAGASLDDYSDSDDEAGGHGDHYDARQADTSSGTAVPIGASGQQRRTAGIVINEAGPSSKKLDLRLNPTSHAGAEQEDELSEYETDTDDESTAKPVFRKPGTAPPQQPTAGSDSSEYETDSDESDDQPSTAPLLKPIFVPKRARTTLPSNPIQQQTEEDSEAKAEAEATRRRQEAHDLAAATIKRQLAESEHASTHRTDVDDTDGLDPDAEFEAWRQRELARLHRDHEALLAKRREQEEIEAFKSLPEAEKERLGRERAAQLQAEKREQRGNPAFLQKYYHKGSFFQDMDILKRDYSEKTSKEVDVSKLPKMMQVRGYGVKGRSKWTHLANEDTSKAAIRTDMGRGCFKCGGPHLRRDCPEGASGENRAEVEVGGRKWGQEAGEEKREKSRSPERSSRRYDHDGPSSSSRESRDRRNDSRRDPKSDPHRSRDDREDGKHSSSSHRHDSEKRHRHHRSEDDHRDKERTHRSHRDSEERHRHRHSRDDCSSRHHHRHRDDDDERRDRHKRREREHPSSSGKSRDDESDRKRSRLET